MGSKHNRFRVSHRILKDSSINRYHEGYTSSLRPGETPSVRNRNPWPCNQRSNLRSPSFQGSQSHSVELFPGSQKAQPLETDNKSEAVKQSLHYYQEIQDGNSVFDYPDSFQGNVGDVYRSERCLSAHSHTQGPSQIPSFPIQRNRFLLQGATIWPCNGSTGIFSGDKNGSGLSQTKRNPAVRLSRRLANSGKLQGTNVSRHSFRHNHPSEFRLDHKLGKIQHSSLSRCHLPRRPPRFHSRSGLPDSSESRDSKGNGEGNPIPKGSKSKILAPAPRPHGQSRGDLTILQTPDAANSVLRSSSLQARPSSSDSKNSSREGDSTLPPLVDKSRQRSQGPSVLPLQAPNNDHHRCFSARLGGGLGNLLNRRPVVRFREGPPHKHARVISRLEGNPVMEISSEGLRGHDHFRQHDDSLIHKSPRRNQVPEPMHPHMGPPHLLPESRHLAEGQPPCRETECLRGCTVQGPIQHQRVVNVSDLGGPCFQPLRAPPRGPVRLSRKPQASDVLYQVHLPSSLGNGRSGDSLDQPLDLRISSSVPDPHDSPQIHPIERRNDTSCTLLAEPALVSSDTTTPRRSPVQVPNECETPISEERPDPPSRPRLPPLNSVEVVHRQVQERGVSSRAADFAVLARRPSTSKTYNSRLSLFTEWSNSHSVDPLEASLDDLCSFLIYLFDNGKQVSTIRNYRSAIAAVHKGFPDGSTLSSNVTISNLLKGMFNKRPPKRRLAPSWSINDVLETLAKPPYEPLHRAPLDALTAKTVFLVAAASARRRSEIHALSIKRGFTRFSAQGVHLLPDPAFLAKNQSMSFTPDPIFLPNLSSGSSIAEDRLVCPVRTLKWYLDKTKHLRSSDSMFVLPRSPYTAASKDTISRWIVSLISKHTNPDDQARAHDLRGQATSIAWFKGVPLQDILNAAAWKTPSSFVSHYLTNIISSEGNFARSVLGSSNGQAANLPPSSRC